MERTASKPIPLANAAFAVAAVAYAIALLWLAWYLPTWTDEEYTLGTTAHGLVYAWNRAITLEEQAPLYFGIVALWRSIDMSVLFTRLFSIGCVFGTLALVPQLVRRLCPAFDARLVTVAIAINPFVIFAALEARLYALALLVGTAMYLTFLDGFLQRDSRRSQVAFAVLAIVGLWLQYYLGFLLPAFGIALLIAGQYRALGAFVLCAAIAAISVVPLAIQIHGQLGALADAPVPLTKVLSGALAAPRLFLGLGQIDSRVGLALIAILIVTARPPIDRVTLALIAIAAVTFAQFVLVTPLTHVQVVPRHQVGLFVPLAFAILASVVRRGKQYLIVLGAAYALVSAYALYATYHTGAKDGDWRRVGQLLSAEARPGDVIALYTPDAVLPFQRYYEGTARIVPLPKAMSTERWSPREIEISSQAEADAILAPSAIGGDRVFLIEDVCEYPEYGCKYIDATIAREYTVLQQWTFYKSEVRELKAR